MPFTEIRLHGGALLGYVCVAVAFCWPLPLQLGSAFLGTVGGDLGVYIWNIWVFRHEIVAHGHLPFETSEILPLTPPPVPLTLHNYTAAAGAAAFLLQPVVGTVAAFNVLTLASLCLSAYAMFLLARRVTGDPAAAWVAGLAFGFSPFMSARATEHFSLIQAAPLPLYVVCLERLRSHTTVAAGVATGACVAWAFLSDPYYAVYCVLITALVLGTATVTLTRRETAVLPRIRTAATALSLGLAAVIAFVAIRGGGRLDVLGVRVSVTSLYTPVLVLTAMLLVRAALTLRAQMHWAALAVPLRGVMAVAATATLLLAPVLVPMASAARDSQWLATKVLWRSSAPGTDLLALFLPSPLHPLWGGASFDLLRRLPNGFVENVATLPWTLLALLGAALVRWRRELPSVWLVVTAAFFLLTLGPFVRVAGQMTYVPGPWAILRYAPGIGAARMPTRMAILVVMGLAVLGACSLAAWRRRTGRPVMLTAVVILLLLVELLPAPRRLHPAAVPAIYEVVAADRRPVTVLDLPFGLRDGLTSYGNTSAKWQYYQTRHEKPILGGYLSRLSMRDVEHYRQQPVTGVLMALSERKVVTPAEWARGVADARDRATELNVGYVTVDTALCPPAVFEFAKEAFDLEAVASDAGLVLHRSRLLERPPPAAGR